MKHACFRLFSSLKRNHFISSVHDVNDTGTTIITRPCGFNQLILEFSYFVNLNKCEVCIKQLKQLPCDYFIVV